MGWETDCKPVNLTSIVIIAAIFISLIVIVIAEFAITLPICSLESADSLIILVLFSLELFDLDLF